VPDPEAYRFLFRNSPAVSLLIAEDGAIVDASESAARTLGRPLADIVGRDALDFVVEEDREHGALELARTMQDAAPREVRIRVLGADDAHRTILFSPGHVLLTLADGRRAVLITGADVTARIEAQQALHESEERYRSLFEESLDVIYITSRDGELIDITPSAEALFGYTREELLQRDVHSLYADPTERSRFQEAVEREGAVRNFEVTLLNRDGTRNACLLTSSLRRDADGSPLGYQGIIRNIAEHKRADEARERERGAFRAIADAAVHSDDVEGLTRKLLEELVRILGFDSGTLHIRDRSSGTLTLAAAAGEGPDEGRTTRGSDLTAAAEGGEPRYVSAPPSPQDPAGSLRAVTLPVGGGGRDLLAVVRFTSGGGTSFTESDAPFFETVGGMLAAVLERQFARQERESLGQQLLHAQKMEAVGTLASGVAHDFNNMLTAIRGFADLAMMGTDPQSRIRTDLESIQGAADRGAALVKQLLLFSRKDAVELQPVDLSRTTLAITSMLGPLIGEDIAIRTELMDDPSTVRADEGSIQQILVNLAVNARDAMPDGGTLTLHTGEVVLTERDATRHADAHAGAYVVLSVADDGQGMDATTLKRIFEPFFSTKGRGSGTGLGLSVVYGIVEQHGGWIDVESEPGRGTCFRIHLPVSEADAKAAPNLPPAHDDDMPDLPLAH
jgi:PAS domain S-box-containing protein